MTNLLDRAQEHFFRCGVYAERLQDLEDKVEEDVRAGFSARLKAVFETVQRLRDLYLEDHKAGLDLLQRSTSEGRLGVLKEQQQHYASTFGSFETQFWTHSLRYN